MLKSLKWKNCVYRMTNLYIHVNRSNISKKWKPFVWNCVDCKKLGDRIKDFRKYYRSMDNVNKLKGEKHEYKNKWC